jgi:hypothetical protein
MYRDPDVQLQLALRHQAELRREAESSRAGRRPFTCRRSSHRLRGLHIHVGTFIVAVGRTFYDEDAPRTRPLHP